MYKFSRKAGCCSLFLYFLVCEKLIVQELRSLALSYPRSFDTFLFGLQQTTMPTTRQPLRERCNVHLNVKTSIPDEVSDNTPTSDEMPSRGRNKNRKDMHGPCTRAPRMPSSFDIQGPHLHPLRFTTIRDLYSLHQLVPSMFISLHHRNSLPHSLITDNGTTFTHIVKITNETPKRKAGTLELIADPKRGLQTLILVVPVPTQVASLYRTKIRNTLGTDQRQSTVLTEHQLLATRDFLSLALPYHSIAHPRDDFPIASADIVRVLITAPGAHGVAADVMTIALCYLTFASEEGAETVLGYIRAEADVPFLWRESLGEGEHVLGPINRVAAMSE